MEPIPVATFKAVRPLLLSGERFPAGATLTAQAVQALGARRLRNMVEAKRVTVSDPKVLERPRAKAPTEILPLNTPAERVAARAELARLEAEREDREALGERLPVAFLNTIAAYRAGLADAARGQLDRATRQPYSLERMAEEDLRAAGLPAAPPPALPEGVIPGAEDGNEEPGPDDVQEGPGKGPRGPFAALGTPSPGERTPPPGNAAPAPVGAPVLPLPPPRRKR